MVRSLWKWIIPGIVLVAAIGVGTFFGVQIYLKHRNEAWLAEADAAYDAGNWQLAKNYYERYIPQDKENVDLLLRYADACRNLLVNRVGALQSAAVSYQQILEYHPEMTEYRAVLIELYEKMGAWGNVEYYTNEWLSDGSEDELVRYKHALALDRLSRRDEAVTEYQALADSNTSHADVYASLAGLLRDRGLDSEATSVFQKALEMRPDDARILVEYARFLAHERDWERVDAILQKAFALAPDDPQVLIAQAQAAGLRDNYDGAVEYLQRAIDEASGDATPHLMLAGAYVAMDEIDRAVETLKEVAPDVQVDNPAVLITLCDLQFSLRQFDDAKDTLERYNQAYPGQLPIEEYFAAKELLVQGQPEQAIEHLAPVLELRPNFLQAQFTLALAYLDAGQRDLARNTLDAYLEKNPSDVRARDLLLKNFGEPVSLEATFAKANAILDGQDSSAEMLLAAGIALSESARRSALLADYADTVNKLLQRSITLDPKRATAYEALVALELDMGKSRAAQAALEQAESAGVGEDELVRSRVAVALESGDVDAALALITATLASVSTPSVDAYSDWAGYLSGRGAHDAALRVLELGAEAVGTDRERTELALNKVSLSAKQGDFDQAISMLHALEPEIPLASPLREKLNETRLELVQQLLAMPDGLNHEIVQTTVAAVRNEVPDNPILKTIDGFMLLRQDPPDLAGAKSMFESAASTNPRDVNVQWGLARVAMLEQDYPRALAYAERAVALAPELPALQLQLGEVLSILGRRLESERALKRVLEDDPDNLRALQLLAASLIERKDTRAARELLGRFEQVAGADPSATGVLRALRGRLLLSEGDSDEAERLLRSQMEADPDNLELRYDLAMTLHKQGRSEEAVALLETWARAHASSPAGWVTVARLCRAIGDEELLDKASTALTRALVADPQFVPAIREMLSVRINQGNLVEAVGLCDRYLETHPESADVMNTKALLLLESPGQLDVAESIIERTIAIDPNPEYIATRGMIRMAKGEHARALEDLLTAAASMSPTTARIDLALAEAYYEARDYENARKFYEAAFQKSSGGEPLNGGRLTRMGDLLRAQDTAA